MKQDRRRPLGSILLAALIATGVGCKKTEAPAEPAKPAEPPPPAEPAKPAEPPPAEEAKSPDAAPAAAATPPAKVPAALMDPSKLTAKAPAKYRARFTTTKGDFVVEVVRDWAPLGADRFYNLVKNGYFDDTRFFRVVPGFMVQWGIHGEPAVNTVWREARIDDDPVKQSNKRGYITFATAGPNTRTTQVFINFVDNQRLDGMGFAPFGKVVSGMNVVDSIHSEYGERPIQPRMQGEGNTYLNAEFPKLDSVKTAKIGK